MGAARERWARFQNRRAGGRARRQHEQQRKTWLPRHRRTWWTGYGAGVVFWLIFWALMRLYPGDQSWSMWAVAGGLVATILVLRQSPPVAIANWQAGAYGEEETAKVLRPLERHGWILLHDLVNGNGNFDHVVSAPTGHRWLNEALQQAHAELRVEHTAQVRPPAGRRHQFDSQRGR